MGFTGMLDAPLFRTELARALRLRPRDAWASLLRVGVGFAIGGGLALPVGLLMGANDKVYQFLNPLVQLIRPFPPWLVRSGVSVCWGIMLAG